jgi:hypothetical protein
LALLRNRIQATKIRCLADACPLECRMEDLRRWDAAYRYPILEVFRSAEVSRGRWCVFRFEQDDGGEPLDAVGIEEDLLGRALGGHVQAHGHDAP